jgi:hypothetical protein
MKTLRIISATAIDSTNINIVFTEALTSNLIPSNISIIANTINIPDSQVLEIKINGSTLSLVCQPLTPLATYFVQLQSLSQYPFESLNGDAIIMENGVANQYLITAPQDPDNVIKNYLNSYFQGNIYNTADSSDTLVSKYINSLANNLSRALYDIRQAGNENYLSFTVTDEQQTRGAGAYDRLNEESAYEIIRVGRTPTGTNVSNTFQFTNFPNYPVTLQRQINTDILTANSIDVAGFFNINTFTLNLNNSPVTRVDSITFNLNTSNQVYTYDISKLGYQIQNSRYDQEFSFTYLPLGVNQIKISELILNDPLFSLNNIINVVVQYESKNLGIVVDPTTVVSYTNLNSIREVIPPIINIFSLKHAPITDVNNNIATVGGVTFTDPNSNTGSPHPAFVNEIPFSLASLPFIPGQYSVDYSTGTVYVFGANLNNDGTGPFPPLATYTYRFTYQSEIDYVYDSDSLDFVSLPTGSLVNQAGDITFNYEEVLIPGTDYQVDLHKESLQERITNRISALNVLQVQNGPITDVFQIFNETSGEIYTLDRWDNNNIYFLYNKPPNIVSQTEERASFNTVSNELLFVNTTLSNPSSLRIFKIFLDNNTLISSTQDSLASSFNTSAVFSNANVFKTERWFNKDFDESTNLTRLLDTGDYMLDYINGIVYVVASLSQSFNIGSVTYKNNDVIPQFPHLISVDDLYYQISVLNPKNKHFTVTSFGDGTITPQVPDPSDELFLNANASAPYQILNGAVGIFLSSSFLAGITNQVKFVRSVYEYDDLLFSSVPYNFASVSTSSGFNISVSSINKQFFTNVQFDGTHYYILINENIPRLSPNITYTFTVTRISDSADLWGSVGTIVPGNPLKLILFGIHSPMAGDQVSVNYIFTIDNLSRIVVDYNRGDYFVDYTYLADEILISYEYGDNYLDFRLNTNLPIGTTYYVSYKAGALRTALVQNFGTLVNVPSLATVDVTLDRERYRDALTAALTSFVQGPTVAAIKNIGQVISHIEPEVIEDAFQSWTLGTSLLNPEELTTTGSFQLIPAKYDNGALINSTDQTVKFPVNSNLRFEEGTFETWIIPQWNGLDNDAELTFNILQNGLPIASNKIFIGGAEYHPDVTNGTFTVNKNSGVTGTPNTNKDGIFIYYNKDISGSFFRWYVRVIDGYINASSSYKFKITSNGYFYDSKSIPSQPSNMTIFSGTNSINFSITSGGSFDDTITFVSDLEHYILDFGDTPSSSRLSIFKDATGYMNFRVFDKNKTSYSVSADVSSWRAGDTHQVAASWKLNTRNNRDEIHLFLDGLEVPNIIKYGQKLRPYLHEKFRAVNVDEIFGSTTRDIVSSVDLHTNAGNINVTSSLNFSSYHIFIGDTIFINEPGFSPTGYTIENINGQTLTLDTPMPITLTDGKFSVNQTQFMVMDDIDIVPNIAVSTIHTFVTGNDLSGIDGYNVVTSSGTDFTTQNVLPGYLIRIDNSSLENIYTIVQVSGNSLTLDDPLSITISGTTFQVYSTTENEIPGVRAVRPSYSISQDVNFHNILTVYNNVYAGDLILIRTLGLNFRKVTQSYYVWSDELENVLMTNLPPPISLDEARITKIILPLTAIGPANSTLSGGVFTSNNLPCAHPSNSQNGRTIGITLNGNNVDFSSPVDVTINGIVGALTISETISFTDYGTLDFASPFIEINYINVVGTPINTSKNLVTLVVKEKYPITHSEFSGLVPVVRYSYNIGGGTNLYLSDGYGVVTDEENLFSEFDVNNYLIINSPPSVAGYYVITGISSDRHSLTISPTNVATALPLPSFSGGVYQVINVTAYRSGLQNGYFTFETNILPTQAYFLSQGFYELSYYTYLQIGIAPFRKYVYLGSDFEGHRQLNGIIDQTKIYSTMLTDTRVGETIPANQRSVTKDFNSLKPLQSDNNTLMLISFGSFPFINSAKFYMNPDTDKQHFQSSYVINENFGNSLVMLDKPILIPNEGILDTTKQGTIEFWMSPLFDTANDPVNRYYFDAYGAVVTEAVSVSNTSVKISAPASKILSVTLQAGDPRIDYFAGGKLEIDTQNAIQETGTSISNYAIKVSNPILQVITVKIVGDARNIDYFDGGSISSDKKTIFLGTLLPVGNLPLIVTYQSTNNNNVKLNTQVIRLNRKLPYQNSNVIVSYIPQGLQGDRISIFKDAAGYMNFSITASGINFVVNAATRWAKGTWHRVKASYKINGGIGSDELRLFLDGYQYTDVTYNGNTVYNEYPAVWGASAPGGFNQIDGYGLLENITFKDPINDLFIGTQYNGTSPVFSLIDNFRISNISRPIYAPYGEPIDVNYSSNLNTVFPVTSDLYTTYLLDFANTVILNQYFTTIVNRETGSFDFSVNILDSFGIVSSNIQVKENLETLINILKPANSKVFIQYIS